MRLRTGLSAFIGTFIVVLMVAVVPARAQDRTAFAALRENGAVALMRHGDAPGGTGDPAGFKLGDCNTQRNLSPKGRLESEEMGRRLKAEHVKVGRILSSPWCRCMDTARLLGMGRVVVARAFGDGTTFETNHAAFTAEARNVIRRWKGPGALFIVTHGVNIEALTGIKPDQGEVLVVKAEVGGKVREVGRIAAAQ